jgi:hypothetical protein
MKRLLFILLIPSFINAQTGSISGNAYWKYNDFVGNKADAGSEVYLFYPDTSKVPLNTQCDVQGNFKFDKLEDGNYLVLIVSKNTNTPGVENFTSFDILNTVTLKYFGFDIHQFKPHYDSVSYFKKNYEAALGEKVNVWRMNKQMKEQENKKISYYNSIHNLFEKVLTERLPFNTRLPLLPLHSTFQPKIKFEELEIKGGNNRTLIADFGITYM